MARRIFVRAVLVPDEWTAFERGEIGNKIDNRTTPVIFIKPLLVFRIFTCFIIQRMGLSGLFKKRDVDINAAMRDANEALESLLSDWGIIVL